MWAHREGGLKETETKSLVPIRGRLMCHCVSCKATLVESRNKNVDESDNNNNDDDGSLLGQTFCSLKQSF